MISISPFIGQLPSPKVQYAGQTPHSESGMWAISAIIRVPLLYSLLDETLTDWRPGAGGLTVSLSTPMYILPSRIPASEVVLAACKVVYLTKPLVGSAALKKPITNVSSGRVIGGYACYLLNSSKKFDAVYSSCSVYAEFATPAAQMKNAPRRERK